MASKVAEADSGPLIVQLDTTTINALQISYRAENSFSLLGPKAI